MEELKRVNLKKNALKPEEVLEILGGSASDVYVYVYSPSNCGHTGGNGCQPGCKDGCDKGCKSGCITCKSSCQTNKEGN